MQAKGISAAELARRLNVKQPTISNLFAPPEKSYSRNIGPNLLKKLATALDVPIEEFHVGLNGHHYSDEFHELIVEYLPHLDIEDKKTILREIIRYLNPPKVASRLISDVLKTAPGKK